jgi:sigma-E factor negative regulatory protein RseA
MKSRVSALMDGELEAHELRPLLEQVARSESLRQDWRTYGLIGDAIRGEHKLEVDLAGRVMAALQNEATVLCPENVRKSNEWPAGRRFMAMAASVAGVGVVAWLALSMPGTLPGTAPGAQIAVAAPPAGVQLAKSQEPTRRMREYLVAHQTYAPAGQMQGGTRYIRTVAAEQ